MLVEALVKAIAAHENDAVFYGEARGVAVELVPGLSGDEALRASLVASLREAQPWQRTRLADTAGALRVLKVPAGDFCGQRVAVVAQWSPLVDGECVVAPYVLACLRALKHAGFCVVLAAGNLLRPDASVLEACDAVLCRTTPGYDFTSWKAAFEVFPSLFQAREVLCTNDSIIGPFTAASLAAVHTIMDAVPCDFWGLVESREKRPHLQSYYLLFRHTALQHPAFAEFWDSVDQSGEKWDSVFRYELVLSVWLAAHGLSPGAYVPASSLPRTNANPAHYFWKALITRFGVPFIKRDLVRDHGGHPHMAGWQACLAEQGYDPHLAAAAAHGLAPATLNQTYKG